MKIPRINPGSVQLTSETGRRRIDRSALSTTGEAVSAVGSGISEIAGMFEKAQAVEQKTRAQNQLDTKLGEILMRATQDTDSSPDRKKFYDEEARKARADAAQLIYLPSERSAFSLEAENKIGITGLKVQNEFWGKTIANNKRETDFFIENKKNEYAAGSQTALVEVNKHFDELVATKLMSAEDAKFHKIKVLKDFPDALLKSDIIKDTSIRLDDSFVYGELSKGSKGAYQNIPEETRTEALELIQKKVRRNQLLFTAERTQDQDKNEANMLVKQTEGSLTDREVKDGLLSQGIRTKFGEKMLKKIYDNPNPQTNFTVYNKVREMQLTNKSPEEINSFILDYSDKLSNEDKKFLLNKTFEQTENKEKERVRYNAVALKIWAGKNLYGADSKDLSDDVVYDFYNRLNKENASGARVDEIAQEVIKDKIKSSIPQTVLMEDVPNFIADRKSIKLMYERESKLKGSNRASPQKSTVTVPSSINFDDI